MKLKLLVLGLVLSSSAMADGLQIDARGKSATVTGQLKSTSSEIMNFISDAYDYGFKDANGEDFFMKKSFRQGSRSFVSFSNPSVKASKDAAFAVVYKVEFKGNVGDLSTTPDKKTLIVKGEAAKMLMGALKTTTNINPHGPVGVGRVSSKTGKVVCTKVVAPRAIPSCVIKL